MRTKEEWKLIFNDQKESVLNIRAYCRKIGINASAFYNAKSRDDENINIDGEEDTFTKVIIDKKPSSVKVSINGLDIVLTSNDLAKLIKELS